MTAARTSAGELRWNIKQSFRDYVAELPDGAETRLGAVADAPVEDLVFPAAAVESSDGGTLVLKFTGGVRFEGHHGMLRVEVADPWIEVDGAGATTLTVNVAPAGSGERRAAIASVAGVPTPTDGAWEWTPSSTTLTLAGAALLGSVYEPGSAADGFALRIGA